MINLISWQSFLLELSFKEEMPSSPDIHFEPIVKLATIETKTLEEDEDVIIKL